MNKTAADRVREWHAQGKLTTEGVIKIAMFKEELAKLAAVPTPDIVKWLQFLAAGLGLSVGVGALGYGMNKAIGAYEDYSLENAKPEMFKKILAEHPDLKEQKELAYKYFESLLHFSPTIAKEPMAAGAYIKQAIQMHSVAGGPLPQVVGELSSAYKSHMEAKKNSSAGMRSVLSGVDKAPGNMIPNFGGWE